MTPDDLRALAAAENRRALFAVSRVKSRAHRHKAREYLLAALMAEYRLENTS